MDLIRTDKGFFKTPNAPKQAEELVIAIHPYFHQQTLGTHYKTNTPEQFLAYDSNLERFLQQNEHPLITFEGTTTLADTNQRYHEQGQQEGYFVLTNPGMAELPWQENWQKAVSLIDSFNAKRAYVIGGYHDSEFKDGCLDGIVQKLQAHDLKTPLTIVPGLNYQ